MQKHLNHPRVEWISPLPLQTGLVSSLLKLGAKRCFDLIFACTVLILLSPLFLLIAALVCLDSPGPAIFIQERVGARWSNQKGRILWQRVIFRCFKFRTMVDHADPSIHQKYVDALIHADNTRMAEIQGEDSSVRKLVHDPRITRIGKILRKFSLDELPQFWNVVLGEMSLVGPRPAIPYEVEMFQPWHLQRFNTKPGITGLCQVTCRCSADFDKMVRLDIQYIQTQSFLGDLYIILKTPYAMLTCRGAY